MADFGSKDIGLRAQKKILSHMATKSVAKAFIDETSSHLLDNLYRLCKYVCGDKKRAEKVVKNIVKIVVKIGITYRNDQLSKEELTIGENFKKKFRSIAMVIVSFYQVEFSYDKKFLISSLNDCKSMIKNLVKSHLTEKSLNRIESIFNFFCDPYFLDEVFKNDSVHRDLLGSIVNDLNKLLENGEL